MICDSAIYDARNNFIGGTVASNTKKKRKKKIYSAPALEKGLDILELFAAGGEAMATTTIAAKLGRSVGEIFRMLMVLEQRGYIVPVSSDEYFLSLKLYTIGARHTLIKRLTIAATDAMKALVREVEQSCHLVVYSKGRGVVVAQVNSPGDRVHSVRLGAEAPLTNSCSGHLLLAFADSAARKEMLAAEPQKFRSKDSRRHLPKTIEQIRRTGFESIKSNQVAGVQDIGYPIFDESASMIAALVMPYMKFLDGSEKTSADSAIASVCKTASEISQAMGQIA